MPRKVENAMNGQVAVCAPSTASSAPIQDAHPITFMRPGSRSDPAGHEFALQTSAPEISVVMPVYNAAPYVARAVRSICEQTFREFEFIIIDDGSTDGTSEILREWAARDSRIRLVKRPNTGVVGASNDGLALARGEFIARMDGDDVALPERFEKQLRYLRAHPECAAVGSWVRMIDSYGDPVRIYRVPTSHEEIDSALFRTWGIFHPTMMTRRELIMKIGGYRQQFTTLEDLDVFLRLGELGTLANLPEPLVEYRQHLNSMCTINGRRMNSLIVEILRQALERRGLPMTPAVANKKCGPDEHDPLTLRLMWAWWAHDDEFYGTARKHALRLLRRRPFDIECWRLLACAIRGELRQRIEARRTQAQQGSIERPALSNPSVAAENPVS